MINQTEITNVSVYLNKVFGFDLAAAETFAKLYVLSDHYKANLDVLVPIFEGFITLLANEENGQVVLNTGVDTKNQRRRYTSVELKRVLSRQMGKAETNLDDE